MRIFAILGVVLALGVGIYLYERSPPTVPDGGSPTEQIDTIAIRQRLLTIAQTERRYQAANGSYATLEQLSQENLLPGGTEQRGYRFTAVVNGNLDSPSPRPLSTATSQAGPRSSSPKACRSRSSRREAFH